MARTIWVRFFGRCCASRAEPPRTEPRRPNVQECGEGGDGKFFIMDEICDIGGISEAGWQGNGIVVNSCENR